MKTIREDVLEAQIMRKLMEFVIDETEATKLQIAWSDRLSEVDHAETIKSLELRIADETTRLKRRLKHVSNNVRDTAHTFNRQSSLKALHERLLNPIPHGGA
ncbi:hypothetical protein QTO30_14560 [Yoonia sp. GPGPB17]|uniref:hypothetical protein n=1 Tax=Yoonia sp. GPGPB17 TaxID=3026147 RepID=UPI0030C38406